jgi:hypothetical protein
VKSVLGEGPSYDGCRPVWIEVPLWQARLVPHQEALLTLLTLPDDLKSDQLHWRDFFGHLWSLFLLTIILHMKYSVSRKSTLLRLLILWYMDVYDCVYNFLYG